MSGGPKAPSINVFHTMYYPNAALLSLLVKTENSNLLDSCPRGEYVARCRRRLLHQSKRGLAWLDKKRFLEVG